MTRQARRPNRLTLLSAVLLAAAVAPAAAGTTARLGSDPLKPGGATPFFVEGDASRFTWIGNTSPRFPGDRRGSLRVLYDTTRPTGRIGAALGEVHSLDEDFRFGAILTIRS
ncbi:MAG TPA: hypothetical protein VFQ07_07420, partial [Candidatus Polarisedimenticolia bacterium]|nr:hypothetical protein [Candidatus Polarisedimenticolia bacterium]